MDSDSVREQLEEGNRRFAAAQAAEADYGETPGQHPCAAVLGCADARAPIELLFQQGVNELFVVRVAGNGLGAEQLGSLAYAALHLGERLRLAVVLGHSGCGAVSAAVDSHLHQAGYPVGPLGAPIRAIIDRALVPVQILARALASAGCDDAPPAAYRTPC